MRTWTVEAVANRRAEIKSKLTKNPGVIFSYKDLMNEFDLSKGSLTNDMAFLMKEDDRIVMSGGKVYCDAEKTPDIHEVKTPERYGKMQNSDGLSDPTAGLVLQKLEPEAKGMIFPKPGDVWPATRSNRNETDLYTVIAINKEKQAAICIKYSKEDQADTCDICLYTKPIKYFVGPQRAWGMPLSYLTRVRERIGEFLDIPVKVEKEIEIVEKEIPIEIKKQEEPVKKSDGLFTKEEVDLMLIKQKAEIYEECFKAIAGK